MNYKNFRTIFSKFFSLIMFAAILALGSAQTLATGNHLDTTFNSDGRLVTDFNSGDDKAYAVAVQPDGKIVVAGVSGSNWVVARYNANGLLDASFSGDGKITTPIDNCTIICQVAAVVIQPDGKILVAGAAMSFIADFSHNGTAVLARYTSIGIPDPLFDGDGILYTSSNITRSINDMTLQPDGKIILVGSSDQGITVGGVYWYVSRYNANGTPDSSFDGDGRVFTDLSDTASAVSVLPGGKILVAGNASGQTFYDFALAMYNPNGSLDTTFDADGKVTTDFNGGNDRVSDMKVQPDGKIVIAGSTQGGNLNFALARFNANGSLDTSFDADGKVTTNVNPSGDDSINAVALQPNGKIISVGANGSDFTLTRHHPDGSLDQSFGQAGILRTDFLSKNEDAASAVALQADGRIVVAGYAQNATLNFAVARYLPNSTAAFDFDGDQKTDIGIFRPAPGEWWINRSSSGTTFAVQFGQTTDKLAPADYTGDGKADLAFFRPSTGFWFVLRSEDSSFYSFPFGASGDIPAPADYDADGRADAAVFRPSTATWYVSRSTGGTQITQFGAPNDVPAVADYDGDGKADIAIWRQSLGQWWINRSALGTIAYTFGNSIDKPVQSDFTGDGKADVALFRPASGEWFVLRSENQSYYSFPFGASGDTPAPGDFDGDGKLDAAVFRPSNSTWFVNKSTGGNLIQSFGQAGDVPVPAAFVP